MEDHSDLKFYGEPKSNFEPLGISALKKRKSEAAKYLKNQGRKNLTGLQALTGLNRRVLLGGNPYILAVRNGIVEHIPYEKYMDTLSSSFKLPKKLLDDIRSKEGIVVKGAEGLPGVALNPGTANNFEAWYKSFIKSQKGEQAFFRRMGKAFEQANLEDATPLGKGPWDVDLSHIFPKSKGGRFTFLEAWFANQARGARDFIDPKLLQEAGLPVDYSELFNLWQLQENGMLSEFGRKLEDIDIDDIAEMSKVQYDDMGRKILPDINAIATRRRDLDNILKLVEQDPDVNIPKYKDQYRELLFESRGGKGADKSLINLAEDAGYVLDPTKRTGRYINVGSGNISKAARGTGQPGVDDLEPGLDKGGWGFGKKVAGGLTIGSAASAILPEVGFSAVNRKTGHELGVLASGEGDMSNVKGAVQGIGEDLVGGAIFSGGLRGGSALAGFGWKKALQMAGKKGVKHFGGKYAVGKLGSKLIPYAGTALLAYSVYDTADAFTEGLTGKGLNERIGEQYNNIIEDAFSPENSFFKQRKVEPENDIQGTL